MPKKKSPYVKFGGNSGYGFTAMQASEISASIHTDQEMEKLSDASRRSYLTDDPPRMGFDWNVALLEREVEGQYGWGKFAPKWLQWMCKPRALVVSLSFIALAQGFFVHGVIPSVHMPLHKRYHISMAELGVIRMMYDVGMIVMFLPAMYFNARGANKAKWLGWSCIVMAAGAFLSALPHFTVSAHYEHVADNNVVDSLCRSNETDIVSTSTHDPRSSERCKERETLHLYKYVFMLGLFLNGMGAAPYFTMGIGYLDENVSQRASVLYTGALSVTLLVGVFFGFIVNAEIQNNVYIDATRTPDVDRKDLASQWVGAWWIGFLIAGGLALLAAIPMFGFPKRLPGALKARMLDAVESGRSEEGDSKGKAKTTVLRSLRACLTNVPYLGLIAEQCAYLVVVTSFVVFLPVYLRSMYGTPEDEAKYLTGAVILAAIFGSITGLYLQHQLQFNVKRSLRFSFAAAAVSLVFLMVAFIDCPNAEFAGGTIPYPVTGSHNVSLRRGNLSAPCNEHCGKCDLEGFAPMCYVGPGAGKYSQKKAVFVYFSPCFAGCASVDNSSKGIGCKCVPVSHTDFNGGGGADGYQCKSNCVNRARAFVIGMIWCALLIFVRINPLQQCLLRSIPFRDRVVGLTLSAVVSRLIAAVPAPALMGLVLQKSCAVSKRECGNPADCKWRDHHFLVLYVGLSAFSILLFGTIGLGVATFTYKETKKYPYDSLKKGRLSSARKRKPHLNSESNSDFKDMDFVGF